MVWNVGNGKQGDLVGDNGVLNGVLPASDTSSSSGQKKYEGKDPLSYANILRSRNKFVDALAIYESILEKDNGNIEAHIGKGICQQLQNMGRLALESFKEAIRLDPQNACALTHCGILYKDERRLVEAAEKPIVPTDLYSAVRDSQLVGMSGFTKEGLPVIAVGVGLSTFDKASIHCYVQSHIQMNEYRDRVILPSATKKFGRHISTCVKVLDMTGLKLSALNQIKLLTVISTIDDLNYPEKTHTYYIVNAPYIFSACWKVVRPLLQERTRNKVQVLSGCGRDDLLRIMDYSSLPHFCKKEGSGSSKHSRNGTTDNCFSLDHAFHQQLYNYIKQQAVAKEVPIKQGSFHVDFPEPNLEDARIAETIESEFQRLGDRNGLSNSLNELKINGE